MIGSTTRSELPLKFCFGGKFKFKVTANFRRVLGNEGGQKTVYEPDKHRTNAHAQKGRYAQPKFRNTNSVHSHEGEDHLVDNYGYGI